MHPRLLRHLLTLRPRIPHRITFPTRELSRRKFPQSLRNALIGRDLGRRFGDDPVLAPAGHLRGADFHEAAAFDGEEVAGREDFDVDDGEDAVVGVMGVDFARDDFFADVVDVFVDGFVDDG